MFKRIAWILLSFLIVTALVLSSCGPADEEEAKTPTPTDEEEAPVVTPETPTTPTTPEEEEGVTPSGPNMVYDSQGNLVEAPQYGGTLTISLGGGNITQITPAKGPQGAIIKELIYEYYLQAGWEKGPAGTNEFQYDGYFMGPEQATGALCESFEMPDAYTTIWHVRPGVHFQNKAPAWGREYTADDAIRIQEAIWTAPWSYSYIDPATPEEDRAKIEKLDDMTFKTTSTNTFPLSPSIGSGNWQFAPEILERETPEGELPWENDWKYMCGTGPFILKDFVEDSAWEFVRNDNYWQHDPLHPDNQLPYIDRIIGVDIPDVAVYYSALQTGKLDKGEVGSLDKAETFRVQFPEMLNASGAASFSRVMFMRTDIEPFNDVRVRQALMLGFDNQRMVDEYYRGDALVMGWPIQPGGEGFTPLDELPDELRELWEYHPDKAKELLADAGYPDGFDTDIQVGWPDAEEIALIVADDWKKIGVNAEVNRIDYSTWSGYLWNKSFPAFSITWWGNSWPHLASSHCSGGIFPATVDSFSNVIDPVAEEAYSEWLSMVLPEQAEERAAMWKTESQRIMGKCWVIYTPTPYPLLFWWPWLKNFYGISTMVSSSEVGSNTVLRYVWIDRDLKYEMAGTRD